MTGELEKKAATLDTCAVIAAFNRRYPDHAAMCLLKEASTRGSIRLVVSRRTLYELAKKPDDALAFAERLEVLPYYGIGGWPDRDDVTGLSSLARGRKAHKMTPCSRLCESGSGSKLKIAGSSSTRCRREYPYW
jgi:hypothetical protein